VNRSVRILAGAEVAIALTVGTLLLADTLGVFGPDSTFTGLLAITLPVVAFGIVVCFLILVPMAIKDCMRKKDSRNVVQLVVISIAICLLVTLIGWSMRVFLWR